jgi:hypothetical protein
MAFRSVPRPSSPPGAKASTECPYRAREHSRILHKGEPPITHHAQEPSTPHDTTRPETPLPDRQHRCRGPATRQATHSAHLFAPLNTLPGRRTSDRPPQGEPPDHPVSSSSRARPETHQNLIHTFKRPTARHQVTQAPHRTARHARPPQSQVIPHAMPNPLSSPRRNPNPQPPRHQTEAWWR